MRLSKLFSKTKKEVSREEVAANAQLLSRAGYIDKLSAGIYSYLPLGWRVFQKIANIIRQEMDAIDAEEVFLPALHPAEPWQKTGRWDKNDDVMFKLESRTKKNYALGWTHEEIITPLVQKFVSSYKDLPVYAYQIQDKFRDELRAKSGLLRGVEFVMKDLYSFHKDEHDLDRYYEVVKQAYFRIFARLGLREKTYLTLASGGSFSRFSHEFQVVTEAGEDEIYLCEKCRLGVNKEIIEELKHTCPECGNKKLTNHKAIEVGNIFKLKDRYTRPFNFYFTNENGKKEIVLMGCYGIGLSRLLGAVVEANHDEKGLIWPIEAAPYSALIIPLKNDKNANAIKAATEKLYHELIKAGFEVLYDDRDVSSGEKLNNADLLGIPIRVVISAKTLEQKSVEFKKRQDQTVKLVSLSDVLKNINNECGALRNKVNTV